ncbi:MAG: cytochrome P450 [Novosphingobium sp.]|nr:cytochrome P450 [Novosphingobium sp.]
MTNYEKADVFNDRDVTADPYPYFEFLRESGPVARDPLRGDVVHVTGYEEGNAILKDDENYSAVDCTTGPFLPFEFDPSRDMDEQIAECRQKNPFADSIINQDLPAHNRSKSILNGIITPARLKANEEFMHTLANQIIDEFIDDGHFDVVSQYGQPFAQLVVADLLGVPQEDHAAVRGMIGAPDQMPGTLGGNFDFSNNPLLKMGMHFIQYITDRRANPREDVLTRLALQTVNDGSLPDPVEVVAVATFLFGAGQDTTVQLFTGMMRYLTENPDLEERLRNDRALIPDFIEEVLRMQGTTKSTFRLCRKPVKIGGVDIEPGTHVMLHLAGMNRDPRKFEKPREFDMDRKNLRTHVTFGRGLHACAGGPLARAEGRISLDRMFDRFRNIRIDPERHGTPGNWEFDYLMNYSLRGVLEMQVLFDRI